MSWLENYLAALSPEDRAEFYATAAKAPPLSEVQKARIALRFQTRRRKNTKKSA